MAEQRASGTTEHQMTRAGSDELEAAQAQRAGINFEWHFGRVTSMGVYEIANSRTVTILWEEGGVSNQQGEITDEQWEIFKLAFVSTGRIAILRRFPEKVIPLYYTDSREDHSIERHIEFGSTTCHESMGAIVATLAHAQSDSGLAPGGIEDDGCR